MIGTSWSHDSRPAPRWLLVSAVFAVGALIGGALLDALVLHPDFSHVDEAQAVAFVRAALDGRGLPFSFGTGAWTRAVQAGLASLGHGQLWLLRLPVWLGLLAELALLWILGQRLLGQRAAACALLVNAICGWTLLRSHSLLSWALLPAAQLAVLALYLHGRRWAWILSGACAVLMFLDYEAWPLALLGLVAALSLGPWDRPRARDFLLGCLPALALVWALSAENLNSWWAWRSARELTSLSVATQGGLQRLFSFFMGGPSVSTLGLEGFSSWPWWALVPLIYGTGLSVRRAPGLLLWILIGMLGLIPHANALEPNRAIAAWPALCLVAGLGLEQALSWLEEQLAPLPTMAVLAVMLGSASVLEWSAFQDNQALNQRGYYARSSAWRALARELAPTNDVQILTGFNSGGDALRYLIAERKSSDLKTRRWVLVPQGLLKDIDPKGLTVLSARDSLELARETLLGLPSTDHSSELFLAEATARNLEQSLPVFDTLSQRAQLRAALATKGQSPLLRNWLWWRWATLAGPVGAIQARDVAAIAQERFKGGLAFSQMGLQLLATQPDWAYALLDLALRRDPDVVLPAQTLAILDHLRATNKVPVLPKTL